MYHDAQGPDFAAAARALFGNVTLAFPGERGDRRLVSTDLGDVRLSALHAGAHDVLGERVVLHSYDPDAIKLIIQTEGLSELRQNGRRARVSADAVVIYDPTRPYLLSNPGPVDLVLLQMPRGAFSRPILDRLTCPFRSEERHAGLQQVLFSLMRTTLGEAARLDDAARASVGQTLLSLVNTMLEGDMSQEPTKASRHVLLQRVKAYIEANLADPGITVAEIARRMGCSPRYIFRAFEDDATTPADYLWNLRLEKARERLCSGDRAQSISDIAFSLGFSSSAHFSRAFRTRFDASPREVRGRVN
ncbi:helix-turn-helix domain-containing protein [Paradevosia shaoguanensis]|uniref:helix-turn-helix domain-containing protein n=1 Tax=Paradevosia shaoguanensis TaxID=1335043 RepID=UPI003C786F94